MNQYQEKFDELKRKGQLAEAERAERAEKQRQTEKKYTGVNLRGIVLDNGKALIQRAREQGMLDSEFDGAAFASKYVATYISKGKQAAEALFSA